MHSRPLAPNAAGEFTDAKGNIVPCRFVKHEVLGVLQIKYWSRKAGKAVTGYISQYEFRPDKSNKKDEL
jgi:hypothetical protein